MSYILDALRRAENDRRHTQGSTLDQITATQRSAPPSPRRLGLKQGIALLIIVCTMLASTMWWWHRHRARRAVVQQVTAVPKLIPAGQATPPQNRSQPPRTTSATRLPPPPARPSAMTRPSGNPIEDAERLSSLDDLMPLRPAPQTITHPPPRELAQPAVNPPPPSTDQLAPAADQISTGATSSISTSPMPAATSTEIRPVATTAADANLPATDNTQALKAMPDSYRADFPQITVQVHVYDNDPTKRWTLIDGKRYREGDTLPQGPKIFKIVPQGIVFDWHGQRVLYPVGS